jgi:simple sugar transport system substrate-binding protein
VNLKKKLSLLLGLLVIGSLLLAACGAPAATSAPPDEGAAPPDAGEEEPPAEPLTVGLILVGPQNDHGWSQAHYEGSQYAMENMPGLNVIVFESLNPSKPEATVATVVDDMISQGAALIITTSDEFEEDTGTVAADHPDVTFINVSGDDAWADGRDFKAPANLGNIMGRMEDMKAIAGCAAALTTQTGKIGYIGPLINFETRRLAASAYLGARFCYEHYRGLDPADLEFSVTWIGFWFNIPGVTLDPTQEVNNLIDGGADVIMSGIDTTEGIDVVGQRFAADEQVWAIPYDYLGACDNAPAACVGVPFFSWGPAYLALAQSVADGSWTQGWDWNGANYDALTDPTATDVGWVDGPALGADAAVDLHDFISQMASGAVNAWTGPINLIDGTEYIAAGAVATDQELWYLPALLEGMGEKAQ